MSEMQNPANKSAKKKQKLLTKIVIFSALIFFGYFSFKYWQNLELQKLKARAETEKFDNIDSEIFDLSNEYKNHQNGDDSQNLPDVTVEEVREKGAEFIYQMLIKNQVQISELRSQLQTLREDFVKSKNQEKLAKIIFSYVEFRQKIFAGKPSEEEFKNFEMMASFDETLLAKIQKLKPLISNFSGQEKLQEDFSKLVPELFANKKIWHNTTTFDKIRRNISKLVVIRRIDGKSSDDFENVISKTEKLLAEKKYDESLAQLLSLDQKFHDTLANFLEKLSTASEVQKIDSEILSYLKTLS